MNDMVQDNILLEEGKLAQIIVSAIKGQGRTLNPDALTGIEFNIFKQSGLIMSEEFLCAAHQKYWELQDRKHSTEAAV